MVGCNHAALQLLVAAAGCQALQQAIVRPQGVGTHQALGLLDQRQRGLHSSKGHSRAQHSTACSEVKSGTSLLQQ
jgi:hypothetical protein